MATMNLRTSKRRVEIDGKSDLAATRFDFKILTTTPSLDEQARAEDGSPHLQPGAQRNHTLRTQLPDARDFMVMAGCTSNRAPALRYMWTARSCTKAAQAARPNGRSGRTA